MRRLLSLAAILFFGAASLLAQTQEISGQVTDEQTKEGLPFANVVVLQNGVMVANAQTDFDGYYTIKLDPGVYDVKVTAVGYEGRTKTGVEVSSNKITTLDFTTPPGIELVEVEVVFQRPIIDEGETGLVNTVTSKEIERLPYNEITAIASTKAGVYQEDDGGDLHFFGGRGDANEVYLDYIRVIGSYNVPVASIEELKTYTAGIPAKFGDATGGILEIVTKGPSSQFGGTLDLSTSQGMDPYGFNRGTLNLTGPILIKNKGKENERVALGYFVAGEYLRQEDASPSAKGVYVAKEDTLAYLEQNPIVPSPVSDAFIVTTETVTEDGIEKVKTKPNVVENTYSLSGKIEAKPTPTITLAFGGNYIYTKRHDWVDRYTMFNYVNNPLYTENTWRVYGRFRQRFSGKSTAPGSGEYEDDNKSGSRSKVQNAYYQVQFDYTKVHDKFEDDSHGFNTFDYGYIGDFDILRQPIYEYGTDDVSGKSGWKQVGYQDTLVKFAPADFNPTGTAYTNSYYELAGATFQDGWWTAPSSGAQEGYYETLDQIRVNNGLLNGDRSNTAHDIWFSTGRQFNGYGITDRDKFSMSVLGSVDVGSGGNKHNLEFGFEFEQRIDRNYQFSPLGPSDAITLWVLMRQLANRHIDQLDTDNPYLLIDGEIYNYNDPNAPAFGQNDTILYQRKYVADQQSYFDKSVRKKLGLAEDNTDYINIDILGPDFFSLDMFSADELLNGGNQTVFYYGYDQLGNRLSQQPSFDDFFTEKDANGNYTRPIGAFRPIYSSVYIQDKFSFKDLLFNIGVRVDRFDANQKVLRDPYTLYQAYTVGEAADRLSGDVPSNIGEDYVVYVDDSKKSNPLPLGYRSGDTWYTADGIETNNPAIIAQSGQIEPFLVYPNIDIKDEEFDPSTSFMDYEPQITVMPRIAFSFKLKETVNFFAHYDILTQRPQSRILTTPDVWYFFTDNITTIINNPSLKPEKTIDYQVGFEQAITRDMAITLSAYYREMKDMVQVVSVAYAYPRDYQTFGNVDFGTVKGFTMAYEMRKTSTSNLSLNFNYTIQFAEGTGSNSTSQANLVNAGQPNLRTIAPLDFDSRHVINLSIDYSYGEGGQYNGPVSKNGKQILANSGINIIGRASSGEPYTQQENPTAEVLNTAASRRILTGSINGSRLPWNFRVDLRIWKDFKLNGNKKDAEGNLLKPKRYYYLNAYFLVQNLLNTANIISVYPYTGNAGDDGYLTSPIGQQDLAGQINAESYEDQYRAFLNAGLNDAGGSRYSMPRNIRLGVVFKF